MSLKKQIYQDLTDSIKEQDAPKVSTLRMLKAEIMKFEVSGTKKEATDDDILSIIQKQIKQRNDSAKLYREGNRPELADKEEKEAVYLQQYLPEQLSREELTTIIQDAITSTGATTKADMGKVMGVVMPQVKGKADGKLVNEIVLQLLP